MCEIIETFLFGTEGVQQAELLTAALISGGMQLIGGLFAGGAAKRREREARKEKQRLERKLNNLEANRQAITNPMSGITNLSNLATDLSGQTN